MSTKRPPAGAINYFVTYFTKILKKLDRQQIKEYYVIRTILKGGFDNMGAKEKSINQIEKQILDEFEEEIMELEKQGRLYQFETAMDHAVEKFNKVLKERTEAALDKTLKKDGKKKLSSMWTTSKNSSL